MFAGQQHAVAQYAVGDWLAQSREAAERHVQVSAVAEARRRQADERREARRRSHSVAVA